MGVLDYTLNLQLSGGLGLSVVDDDCDGAGRRREILYASLKGISVAVALGGASHRASGATHTQPIAVASSPGKT